ncbi:MAG: ThiF family adenylyltransferase [Planctomycetota bacterium]|nr:ThiF family adenylyltransferase [Planctomycetota bacterium]
MSDRPLVIDDDRYSRLRLIAWWDQEKLAQARVLVVGAGALGNEVLKNLALMGLGHIYIVDFDQIEESNLTRSVLFRRNDCGRSKAEAAASALKDLNPDLEILALNADILTDLGLGMVAEMDVVMGCLDNREARLWLNRMCWKTETPWIDGGIQEINGVVKAFVPPESACYECAMTETDYRLINLRYSCPLLRQEDIQSGKVPTAPTISSIIAGMQTQEALKLIHDMPVEAGKIMVFNGVTNQFYKTEIQRKDDCLSHETYTQIAGADLGAREHRVSDLLNWAQDFYEVGEWSLVLDRDLVTAMSCHGCGRQVEILKPLSRVGHHQAICEGCGQVMKVERAHRIDAGSRLVNCRLIEVGVPLFDIVRLRREGEERFVRLDRDRSESLSGVSAT